MTYRKTYNIFVTGSLAYDRIMDFPGRFADHILPEKIHILNVSFTINNLKESFGGTAGNIAYNLSLLGERPKILAVAGSDFGKYEKWLKKNKIDISNVKIVKDKFTASCYIMTDKDDNQITGFYVGSLTTPRPPLVRGAIPSAYLVSFKKQAGEKKYPPLAKEGQGRFQPLAIIAPDYVARMLKYAKIFKRLKIPYIFDPGQQITSLKAKDLKYSINGSKVLIGNDYEIQLILDKLTLKQSQLVNLTEILVITRGAKGSLIFNRGRKIIIPPAKPKNSLDPTGAGDAYRAGLIKGLISGWPLEKTGRLAGLVAVYTVEKYGTQTHRFTWRELRKRYRDNYKDTI